VFICGFIPFAMPAFDSDGVTIAYDDLGSGKPIVLVHGFASGRVRNWKDPRWYDTLLEAGHRIVALDCRGHGESGKPHDPALYTVEHMTGDVVRLMDHLGIARAGVMGYSMGGRIAAAVLARHGDRFEAGVLGGVGGALLGQREGAEAIARALEADNRNAVKEPAPRTFRIFAEQGRNDLKALAACMRGLRRTVDANDLQRIAAPVLVVAGRNDTIIGNPRRLADVIPKAELLVIPGRDHLTVVGDKRYKEAVLRFLETRSGEEG
jgi:pimeloyl-ACP methyl ester carboxylesterase